jgi:hypothetical protein
MDYNAKLKSMAKEMSTRIDDKEQNYNMQLRDFIRGFLCFLNNLFLIFIFIRKYS